jgi:subtilase family serine protease
VAIALVAGVLSAKLLNSQTSNVAVHNCLKELACYTPQQFRVAYGIQPLLDRGIDGRGETVVLLEQEITTHAAPPNVTDIRQDLARFDNRVRPAYGTAAGGERPRPVPVALAGR